MNIVLGRLIKMKSMMAGSIVVYKVFKSDIVPQIGFIIEDSAFGGNEDVKVFEVSLNYEFNYAKVFLDAFEVNDTKEDIKMAVDFYEAEGWTTKQPVIDK